MPSSKTNFSKLRRELAAEFAVSQGKTRRQVIETYARRAKNGRVLECTPSFSEIGDGLGDDGWGSNGKIIYDSLDVAVLAAREFRVLGAKRMYAYVCHRSRHGHAHLTSKARSGRPAQVVKRPEQG